MVLSISEARAFLGLVIPVHFDATVSHQAIRAILEPVFRDQELYCERSRAVVVVDIGTPADEVLSGAGPDSPLHAWPIHRLARNRAKAGAVEEGLRVLLQASDAPFLITRDCDGDHLLDDLPRLVAMAMDVRERTAAPQVAVMGARPSLEKPMGWVREEWEHLTNRVLVDLVDYQLAGSGRVLDKRFWSRTIPDLQSGFRVYSRAAAEMTVSCLEALPPDRELITFACEALPFLEGALQGCIFGEVQRMTLVEQPVSSYSQVDLAAVYGRLLAYAADRWEIPRKTLLQWLDNQLPHSSLVFSDNRAAVHRCRRLVCPEAGPLELPAFL